MRQVFVYGTLKRGYRWHFLLKSAKYLGDRVIPGFKLINYTHGNYPIMLVSSEVEDLVYGEMYEVDDATWKQLLLLERGYAPTEVQQDLFAFVAEEDTKLYDLALQYPEVTKKLGVYVYA